MCVRIPKCTKIRSPGRIIGLRKEERKGGDGKGGEWMGRGVDVQESERERKGKARNVKDESPLRNAESSDKNIKQPIYYTNKLTTKQQI